MTNHYNGHKVNLLDVRKRPTLRLDAKQVDPHLLTELSRLDDSWIELGDFLPQPFAKGKQPNYLKDDVEASSETAGVLNTLSIRPYFINYNAARLISGSDFQELNPERQLKNQDVVLTMDGGTSIGKAAIYQNNEGNPYTIDSHIAILRPEIISPLLLVYLLNSSLGQQQFKLAESGSSGQTSVNEEDIRRFRFPLPEIEIAERKVMQIHKRAQEIEKSMEELYQERLSLSNKIWK